MIPYILHVTVIITVCFLFYKILLQKETFYRLNRWTLMACLAVSFALPLLPAPRQWSWRGNYENILAGLLTEGPAGQITSPRQGTSSLQQASSEQKTLSLQQASPQPSTSFIQPNSSVRPTRSANPTPRHQKTSSAQSTGKESASAVQPIQTISLVQPASPMLPASSPATNPSGQLPSSTGLSGQPSFSPGHPSSVSGFFALTSALQWLFYLYCFGVIVFGANFLLQIVVLLYQSYRSPVIRDGRFRIVETSGDRAPCSFGNIIFINPSIYDWETYNQILIHEKIHVNGRHTLDILLAEIVVVLQWFNPFAWLYRKEVENNLEFLTDQSVLLHREVERSAYQLSLLRVSAPHLPFSITTNYNQSLLKRRIVMMNSQHSSLRTVWKYFFLVPVLTLLVCALNKPAVFGQSSNSGKTDRSGQRDHRSGQNLSGQPNDSHNSLADTSVRPGDPSTRHADPNSQSHAGQSTDPAASASPKETHRITATGTSDSRSDAYDQADVDNLNLNLQLNVQPNINPVTVSTTGMNVSVNPDVRVDRTITVHRIIPANLTTTQNVSVDVWQDEDETEGSWFVTTYDDKLEFELKGESEFHNWSNTFRVEKSEINPFPGQGNVEFKLVREAGTIVFKGQFDGQQGFGHYKFTADEPYFNFLKQQGVEEMEDARRMSFFIANVKKDYVTMIVHNGFPHITRRNLVSMAAMHVDEEYIRSWKKTGYDDLSERDLISAKAMHIDPDYVREISAAGYEHLSMRELTSLKSQHIDGQYIRSFHSAKGSELPPVRDLISFKASHIDSGYLDELKKLGYTDLSYRDIISLHSMHITPDFIKSYQAAGYKDIPARSLITLKSMNISPEYIKGFKDIGYTNIELRDLNSLKAMNITPDFIKGFKDVGYSDIPLRDLSSLKSMNITPDFVKGFQKIGYDKIPVHELRSLKAMGVDADYVAKMKEKGFDSKDLNKYIRLKSAFQ